MDMYTVRVGIITRCVPLTSDVSVLWVLRGRIGNARF